MLRFWRNGFIVQHGRWVYLAHIINTKFLSLAMLSLPFVFDGLISKDVYGRSGSESAIQSEYGIINSTKTGVTIEKCMHH